jgi:hypothetical protein
MRAHGLSLCILLVASVASAERLAVLPVSGLNVHEGTLAAAQDVLKGELQKTGRFQVTLVPGVGRQELEPEAAVELTRQHAAELGVVLQVTRLGTAARLRMTAYHAGTGQVVWIDELSAASPDDMPAVLARLAQGFATGQRAVDNADIETVTQKESSPLLKRRATNVFGLELGYLVPLSSPYDGGQLALPGLALFWLYDARSFLADIAVGFHTNGDEGDFWVGLGAYYPFSRGDLAPFIGGGLRYAFTRYGGYGGSGMVAVLTGGLLLGRLATVQIRGDVSYFFNLFTERYASPFVDTPDGRTRSHGIAVNLGLGF